MEHIDVDLYLTPSELASLLKITVQGLYKQLRECGISTQKKSGRHKIYPEEVRKYLSIKGLDIPTAVVAVHIVKGGVGKTTLVHALASRASMLGLKTLMLDLDQQANLTTSFGIYTTPKVDPTILDVINGHINGKPVTIKDALVEVSDYLHILPSNLNMANLDLHLIHDHENLGKFFQRLLEPISSNYDIVFIDCPPSLSRVTTAAHCYADRIIMPVNTDRFSLDGLELTLEHLQGMIDRYDIDPSVNIVINKFDARQKILSNAVIDSLTAHYREYLMDSFISVSKAIDNCIAQHKCVWNGTPSKNPALEDMNNLLIEILDLERLWNKNVNKPKQETFKTEVTANA